jgi:protocadherin-15
VAESPVIVNLVGPDNFLILTVQNATSESLQKDRAKIARVIEERTALLIEIEKIDSRRLLSANNTIEVRHHDSDVWFYAIDPKSEKILLRNSSLLHR